MHVVRNHTLVEVAAILTVYCLLERAQDADRMLLSVRAEIDRRRLYGSEDALVLALEAPPHSSRQCVRAV